MDFNKQQMLHSFWADAHDDILKALPSFCQSNSALNLSGFKQD